MCAGRKEKKILLQGHYGEYKRFEMGNMYNAALWHQLLTRVFETMQRNDKDETLRSKK
jgi:hypothetical protein